MESKPNSVSAKAKDVGSTLKAAWSALSSAYPAPEGSIVVKRYEDAALWLNNHYMTPKLIRMNPKWWILFSKHVAYKGDVEITFPPDNIVGNPKVSGIPVEVSPSVEGIEFII